MAGQGRKTFVAGDVLLAQELNDYLMDQSVMNFATTAARSSAIPTPTEGLLSLTLDNDQIDYYNGTAWVPALPIGAWKTDWSPTITGGWTASGTWSTYYTQIGKTVHYSAVFTLTNTTTPGNFVFSLPITARVANSQVHSGWSNAGSTSSPLLVRQNGTTTVNVTAMNAAGTYLSSTNLAAAIPGTWAIGNIIAVNGTYEAA
jgi:hypothetical protein